MSKKFIVSIDAMLKIRDLSKSGTRGYIFSVTDEEYEKSKDIKTFLKVGWIKEVTESKEEDLKPKSESEKIIDNNVKLRRDEKEDVINRLKDLKQFKSNYPYIIDEKFKITEQLEKYERLLKEKIVDKLNEVKEFKEKNPGVIDETLTPLEQIKVYEYNKQSKKEDDDSFAKKHRVIEMNEDTPIGIKLKKPSIKNVVEKLKETKAPEVKEAEKKIEKPIEAKEDDELIDKIFDEEKSIKQEFVFDKNTWSSLKWTKKSKIIKTANLNIESLKWIVDNDKTEKVVNAAKKIIDKIKS